MSDIISVPHPTLRQKAKTITRIDIKLKQNIKLLLENLISQHDPDGVGLAFPQINKSIRGFAFRVGERQEPHGIRVFLNPSIVAHSRKTSLGDNPLQPYLEGCLSVPNLWGPVPRFEWLDLHYQVLSNNQLVDRQDRFGGFLARGMQHELDHLDGVIFTDHILQHNLPIYFSQNGRMKEFDDRELMSSF